MRIEFTKRFDRVFKKFLRKHPDYKKLTLNRVKILQQSPNHPSLRLHKLSNKENEYAISVDHSIRIVFFREKDIIYLLDIGSHDDVY